jgi:WD40 repeat protein
VTCLDFHPRESILASGSKDFSVKLFDYSKASAKKAARTLSDSEQINSISFHPSGKQCFQMVYFQTKNTNVGKFLKGLQRKKMVFYDHFIYFTAKWSILWPFGTFCGYLGY